MGIIPPAFTNGILSELARRNFHCYLAIRRSGKICYIRDFEIFNSQDRLMGRATTSWMLIDLAKFRPITMPDFITNIQLSSRSRAINDSFEKLPDLKKVDHQHRYYVRLSDLDINRHVNNVKYIEWAIETIPLAVWKNHQLSELQISFRAESKYGDKIIAQTQKTEDGDFTIYLHKLLKEANETELAVARTSWMTLKS